ncbi:MAG: lipopolysaccharide kinase InaA family protein [Candidatus Bathyarchaeales archaeon]
MAQPHRLLDKSLAEQIVNFCSYIANFRETSGICVCGDYAFGMPSAKTPVEVLLIVNGFPPRVMAYVKFYGDKAVIVYAVDKWVFERDVDGGFLGEAFAVQLLFPYIPLNDEAYLKAEEVKLKRRLILELLENLVLDFPELSYELRIKPEFFAYEAMLSRARLFPPLFYNLSSFLREDLRSENLECVMKGYLWALEELERAKVVEREDGFFKISPEFACNVKGQRIRFVNLLKSAQKALFLSLLGTFPKIFRVLSQNRDILLNFQILANENFKASFQIEDPKKYLFVPTAHGLVPLANKIGIEAFARKTLSAGVEAEIKVEELGGVLNDVYLVRAKVNGEERKFVVKSFKDWSGFKWFPLTLWTAGTKTFALLGRSRLERECAISQFLSSNGFTVPKLLSVSHHERLVFMEYLEGESLEKVVKRIMNAKVGGDVEKELKVVHKVGETFAKIHALNVTLGDTKPENILLGKSGEICLLDFEQASRNGDKSWDIAEFLYYVGHYASPFAGARQAELITRAFIKGYLEAGGDIKAVKAAGKPKYTKVFSVFTFPHVVFVISNLCKKAEQLRSV